jgi:hypothetical protein
MVSQIMYDCQKPLKHLLHQITWQLKLFQVIMVYRQIEDRIESFIICALNFMFEDDQESLRLKLWVQNQMPNAIFC